MPFISSLFIGAICASTDPVLSPEVTTHLLNITEPKLIFVSEDCIDLIEESIYRADNNYKLIMLQESNKYENVPNIFKRYSDEDAKQFGPVFVEDTSSTACIVFSSGTTGFPKGSCLNHNYLSSNVITKQFIELSDSNKHQDTVLSFTTLYWISGVVISLASYYYGFKRLTCYKFDPETIWGLVGKYNVKILPMSYYHCMEALDTLKVPQPNLNHLVILGGPISQTKQKQYADMLPNAYIINSYSMTEIGSVSINTEYRVPSSGKPVHNGQVIKIVNPETEQPLDLNKTGEIRVKHKFQMNGYYKKNSTGCWDTDGFFKTGVIGYLSNEFDLFVVDRNKEMFKYRSWHVIPKKIEHHILKHTCVTECVVIGVPVEHDDNHAMAIVVLKHNSHVNSEELLKHANNYLDDIHQIRAGIKFVTKDAIPYTTTGKINRLLLKTQILNGRS